MSKKLGQNFLINPMARKQILDALELQEDDGVWEIGPGLGAMTRGLLDRGAVVTAFELDKGFCAALTELFAGEPRFTLIQGDALKTWPLVENKAPYLFGNLPYNIAAALLGDFIEKRRFFNRIVATVQREVAARMIARPGSKDYSSFSVLCGSVYRIKPLMILKGPSFYPAPRVDSQAVRFDLLPEPERTAASPMFMPLVRALFASRRKTVKNNLQKFLKSGILQGQRQCKVEGEELLKQAHIPADERAENLSGPEFASLAVCIDKLVRGD
jgi:16S rRNA (adenine1518-N6/adenine1519-N6)-dimethyltransferase